MIRALSVLICLCASAGAESIPRPDFNRIDYAHPERYLAIEPSLGAPDLIRETASSVSGKSSEGKLVAIHRWIAAHLRDTHDLPYEWRTFDKIIEDGTTNGNCADTALVFGALARAVGIPTVWVKTMDVDWIREFVRDPDHPKSWRGHVFLELFLDGKWKLLDASQFVLYDDYSPRMRILPGNRWAYDKGGDPFALILSSRGDAWSRQTAAFFRNFDPAVLPVGEGRAPR